jgi:hypothetical protein
MKSVRDVLRELDEEEARSLLITAATADHRDQRRREELRDAPLADLTRLALDRVAAEGWAR